MGYGNSLTESPSREEIIECVMNDISKHSYFVMSGTIGSILRDLVNPLFDLAVLITVLAEIRKEWIRTREVARFGKRVLEGGDMHEFYKWILDEVELYETGEPPQVCLKRHELWAAGLHCPVLRIDGTKSISDNDEWLAEQYLLTQST